LHNHALPPSHPSQPEPQSIKTIGKGAVVFLGISSPLLLLLVFFSSKNENIKSRAGGNYARGLLSKRKLLYILHTRNSFVSVREEKEINQRE